MIKGKELRPRDLGVMCDQLTELTVDDLMPLPAPFDKPEMEPGFKTPKPEWNEKYNSHLDGFIAIDTFERPKNQRRRRRTGTEIPARRRTHAVCRIQRRYPAGPEPVHGILRKM